MPWLSDHDVASIGFASVGENVLIEESSIFVNPSGMRIGSHVRVDAFSFVMAGPEGLTIGNYVHFAPGTRVSGGSARVVFGNFSGLSSGVAIYTATDDYRGGALTNPTVPRALRDLEIGPVELGDHVVVGANSVILPGVEIGRGAAVGALTLVNRSVAEGDVVSGNPMRRLGVRDVARLAALEQVVNELPKEGRA